MKPKIALFLGAGASTPFGKPVTSELKQRLVEKYAKDISGEDAKALVYALVSHRAFEDIEYVIQAIKDIHTFSSTEGAKFLFGSNAPEYVANIHGRNVPLRNLLAKSSDAMRLLEGDVFENYRWNNNSNNKLDAIYEPIFKMLGELSDGIHVFTTNYDRVIEQFCAFAGEYDYVDGFEYEADFRMNVWQDGSFKYVGNRKPVYLYKLHGSLGWKETFEGLYVNLIEEGISDDHNFTSVLIYPSLCPKDGEEKEPFKTIRTRFQEYLKEAQYCIVIGFSFRDEHINKIFREFLQKGGRLIIFSPTAQKDLALHFQKEVLTSVKVIDGKLASNTVKGFVAQVSNLILEKPLT